MRSFPLGFIAMRLVPVVALLLTASVASIGSARAFTQDNVTNRTVDGGQRFADDDAPSKWGGSVSVNGHSSKAAQAADDSDTGHKDYNTVDRRAFNKTGYFEPIILLPAPK